MTPSRPDVYNWRLCARTHIWTGDADREGERVITTGLLGSIRWWCEVLVRGLGGSACDPTDEKARCPASDASPGGPGHRCVVCELFGCTDWARKFRFDVLDDQGSPREKQIHKDDVFILRFTPLRPVRREEWTLIDLTLRLIADYGAVGGKTVLKPSAPDYGIVELKERPEIGRESRASLENYVRASGWRRSASMWASLANLWFVGRCLQRHEFDKLLKGATTGSSDRSQGNITGWLQGKSGVSKKIFSFKNPPRTFGFMHPSITGADRSDIQRLLRRACLDLPDDELQTGPDIVERLFQSS